MSTPIVISSLGGQCPFQAVGSFYGNPFYFRARHGEWDICIARPGEDPVMNASLFHMEGDDPDEGWMPTTEAIKFIGQAFNAFTMQYAAQIYHGADYPPRAQP